jgi:hypothetical protein
MSKKQGKGGGKDRKMAYAAQQRIRDALDAAGLPFDAALVDRVDPGWHVVTRADGVAVRLDARGAGVTPAQQDSADALVLGLDLTSAGLASAEVLALREQAKAVLDTLEALGKILRGEADVFKDEFNIMRRQVVGVKVATWNPTSMTNGTGQTSPAVTVAGAALGDFVCVAAPYDLAGVVATAYVSAAGTVKVRLHNASGVTVDFPSGDWRVVVWRPEEMPPRDLGQLRTAIRARLDSGSVDAPPP